MTRDYELAVDPEKATGGYAALAYRDDESDTYVVNGVALGPNDETQGMSGKRTRWPPDVLEESADLLVGAPITEGQFGSEHPGAEKDGDSLQVDEKAPDDATIGQVTKTRWDDALGLLWQGRIDSEETADAIERGERDVSPVISRDVAPIDDEPGMWEAATVHGYRDLTVLPPKVPGAAPSNHVESGEMAEALAAAFPTEADDGPGSSAPDDDPDTADRASTGGADTGADADADDTTMTNDNDLTERQRELLAAAQHTENPTVVAGEDAERLQQADELLAAADEVDGEAVVMAEDEHEALTGMSEELNDWLDEALVEQRGLREGTVEAMSFEAKAAEFSTDDGGLDAEALVMSPETGDPDDDEQAGGVDALSGEEREHVELCVEQSRRMSGKADDFADEKREEAAEALGLDPDAELTEIEEAL